MTDPARISQIFGIDQLGGDLDPERFRRFAVPDDLQQGIDRLFPDMPRMLVHRRNVMKIGNAVHIAESAQTDLFQPAESFFLGDSHDPVNDIVAVGGDEIDLGELPQNLLQRGLDFIEGAMMHDEPARRRIGNLLLLHGGGKSGDPLFPVQRAFDAQDHDLLFPGGDDPGHHLMRGAEIVAHHTVQRPSVLPFRADIQTDHRFRKISRQKTDAVSGFQNPQAIRGCQLRQDPRNSQLGIRLEHGKHAVIGKSGFRRPGDHPHVVRMIEIFDRRQPAPGKFPFAAHKGARTAPAAVQQTLRDQQRHSLVRGQARHVEPFHQFIFGREPRARGVSAGAEKIFQFDRQIIDFAHHNSFAVTRNQTCSGNIHRGPDMSKWTCQYI